MEINIKVKDIKAVSLAMAVKDVRYYLNGVFVESNGRETRIVATDGHRLHAISVVRKDQEPQKTVEFIMPSDLVKTITKAKTKNNDEVTLFYCDDGFVTVTLPDQSTIKSKTVEGKFPDYRRIIPTEYSEPSFNNMINPEYALDAYKALHIWFNHTSKDPMALQFCNTGENTANTLTLENDGYGTFLAIVMPIREPEISCIPSKQWKNKLSDDDVSV